HTDLPSVPTRRSSDLSIGFGDKVAGGHAVESYARLEGEQIDARLGCEMKDHPLFLVPRGERQRVLIEHTRPGEDFQLAQGVLEGDRKSTRLNSSHSQI